MRTPPFPSQTPSSEERVVRPVGDLTGPAGAALRRSVAGPLARGATQVVLDLSLTRRIDASGSAALIECLRTVRAASGTLVLLSAPRYLKALLRDVVPDEDAWKQVAAAADREADELGAQRRRLEAEHGRRICATFVSRNGAGHPLLCGLSLGHDGTHRLCEAERHR